MSDMRTRWLRAARALRAHVENAELTPAEARSPAVRAGIVNALHNQVVLRKLRCESSDGGVTLLAYLPGDKKPVRVRVY